jgi:hypothetical protein
MRSLYRRLTSWIYCLVYFTALLLAVVTFPSPLHAQEILLDENFDDNNANDGTPVNWDEFSSTGSWQVLDGKYVGTLNPNTNISMTTLAGDLSWNNYELEVDVKSVQGVDRHIYFRFSQYHVSGYSVKYSDENFGITGAIELQKHGQNVVLQTNTLFKSHIGETHHFKIRANDNHIQVYADNNQNPILDYIDNNNPILNGKVGFEVQPSGIGATNQTSYDNLIVRSISSSSNSLDVPDIKQYSSPWGDDEYDNASKWNPPTSNTTMARWACAVTSAAMVFQYHGHNVNPDTLNTYLNDNDGYTRNGGVIWSVLTGYTDEHESENSPVLEFTYHNPGETYITNELDAERPQIFKLENHTNHNTHFIVAKGAKEKDNPTDVQDYYVNDPGSDDNELSSESEDSFNMDLVRVGTFTPSHTDLSYIVLFIDDNVNLKVYDHAGVEITDGYVKEYPILDASDKTTLSGGGKILNAFYLPKPASGMYKIEVTGEGSYQLDSYLHDANGKANVQHIQQSLTQTQKDTFHISFDNQNFQNSKTNEISFEALLKSLDTAYKNKLIKDKLGYLAVRALIQAGQIEYSRGRVQLAKISLNLAKTLLLKAKASQIDLATRDQLVLQINTLISVL